MRSAYSIRETDFFLGAASVKRHLRAEKEPRKVPEFECGRPRRHPRAEKEPREVPEQRCSRRNRHLRAGKEPRKVPEFEYSRRINHENRRYTCTL